MTHGVCVSSRATTEDSEDSTPLLWIHSCPATKMTLLPSHTGTRSSQQASKSSQTQKPPPPLVPFKQMQNPAKFTSGIRCQERPDLFAQGEERRRGLVGWGRGKMWGTWGTSINSFLFLKLGFPGGSDSKESACNTGDVGSIPGLGRSPGEGHCNPLQYSCLENSMDRGTWQVAVTELQRVGHDWATKHSIANSLNWVVVTYVCSLWDKLLSCTLRIGILFFRNGILQLKYWKKKKKD